MRARTLCAVAGCPETAVSKDGRCEAHRRRGGYRWRVKAKLVVARAGGRCERCGRPHARLSAHHVRSLVMGGRELVEIDELLAICASCQAIERPALERARRLPG
jgi:5-methylcytosine-specific restriction endonuclease McrA